MSHGTTYALQMQIHILLGLPEKVYFFGQIFMTSVYRELFTLVACPVKNEWSSAHASAPPFALLLCSPDA